MEIAKKCKVIFKGRFSLPSSPIEMEGGVLSIRPLRLLGLLNRHFHEFIQMRSQSGPQGLFA
eukprot:5020602-Heterocapsa_arctica.AAC.1